MLDTCRSLLPCENFVYVSDSRMGGWGNLCEEQIARRVESCVNLLLNYECKAVVAACNTATEVAIGSLRRDYEIPFVGLEPALKPAKTAFPDGRIAVICTPATARQEKFRKLMESVGDRNVTVYPQPKLAVKIEKNLDNLDCLQSELEQLITCECGNPDAVVLGCTHYVFVRYIFENIMRSPTRVFDGNVGAARKLKSLLGEKQLLAKSRRQGEVIFDTI